MPTPSGTLADPHTNCNQLPLRFTCIRATRYCPARLYSCERLRVCRSAVHVAIFLLFLPSSVECTRKAPAVPACSFATQTPLTLPAKADSSEPQTKSATTTRSITHHRALPASALDGADRLFCRIVLVRSGNFLERHPDPSMRHRPRPTCPEAKERTVEGLRASCGTGVRRRILCSLTGDTDPFMGQP